MAYRLLECRVLAGISQEELGRRCGLPQRNIAYYESAEDLKVSTALSLARALGVTLSELLGIDSIQTAVPKDLGEVIGYWGRLNAAGKSRLLDYARMLTMVEENTAVKGGGLRGATA